MDERNITEFNISFYTSLPEKNPRRLERINLELEKLDSLNFPSEQLIRQNLKSELISEKISLVYPKLDVSFLKMSVKKDYVHTYTKGWKQEEAKEIFKFSVPRFAVYNINDPEVRIDFGYTYESDLLFPDRDFRINFTKPNNNSAFCKFLGKSFDSPKIHPSPSYKEEKYYYSPIFYLSKELQKAHKKTGMKTLTSKLNILIPTKIKEKIEQAKELFGNDIYFIKEMNPEEWNLEKQVIVEKDPIVGGLDKDKCYYIDSFNPTPIEEIISQSSLREN